MENPRFENYGRANSSTGQGPGRARRLPLGWILLAFIFLFGSIFLGVGLAVRSSTQPFENGVTVEGVILDQERSRGNDSDVYQPVVEFEDPDTGETFIVVGTIGSSSRPTIGDTRTVSFPVGSPSEARVIEHQWFPWVFIIIGAVVLMLGILGAVRALLSKAGPMFARLTGGGDRYSNNRKAPEPRFQDAQDRPIDEVYQPFGGDGSVQDSSIQNDPVQDGPITGGPLK